MSDTTLASDLEPWSGSYSEESESTSSSVEAQPSTEESTAASTRESTPQKDWSQNYEGDQPKTSKSVAFRHKTKRDQTEKTRASSRPVDDVANTIRQDGYDLLTQSLAKLINSLSAAVDACCGPSQPPAAKPCKEADIEENRLKGPLTGDAPATADPGKTLPEERAPGSNTAACGEVREEKGEQKVPVIVPPETSEINNTREPAKTSYSPDLIPWDHRTPLELLEAEIQAKEALEGKFHQGEIWHLASEKPAHELLETDQADTDASKPSASNVSMPSEGESETFAAKFVRDLHDDPEAQMVKAESIGDPSLDESPTLPSAGIAIERDAVGTQGSLSNEGENNVVCAEEGKSEEELVFEEPNVDAPGAEEHDGVVGAVGDAAEGTAGIDTQYIAGRAWLPADVVEKIPELPRETSSSATSAHSNEVVRSATSNGNTELVFRYKTPIGLTVTLLFLTAVVIFSVTVSHVLHKGANHEEGGTNALLFSDLNTNESSRALLIPEEETEMGVLTIDVN